MQLQDILLKDIPALLLLSACLWIMRLCSCSAIKPWLAHNRYQLFPATGCLRVAVREPVGYVRKSA